MRIRLPALAWAAAVAGLFLVALPAPPLAAQADAPDWPFRPDADAVRRLVAAWNGDADAAPSEVLVGFRSGTRAAGVTGALSVLRGPAEATVKGDALLVRAPGEPDAAAAAAALARQPEVAWAQPNYRRHPHATPSDPAYFRQWNFDLIDLPRAWDLNPGANAGVTIAVIDSGVTTVTDTFPFTLWTGQGFETVGVPVRANPDLAAARVIDARDFVFWDGPVLDFYGHGTHVAGTALQDTNNGVGTAGVAYRARLMPLKVCLTYWDVQFLASAAGVPGFVDPNNDGGDCSDGAIIEAIHWAADHGAQVINISLGAPFEAPALRSALQYAVAHGSFVTLSAGNGFEHGNEVEFPAGYADEIDGVVAVGAVGPDRRRAYYSSTGPHVELAAPGGNVRVGGLGGVIFQTGLDDALFDPFTIIRPRFDTYALVPDQGTSMAAPHVAGVAALLYAQGVTDPAAIEAALEAFASDLGAAGRDHEHGYGLIDPRRALRGLGLAR